MYTTVIPQVPADHFFTKDLQVTLKKPKAQDGNITLLELLVINMIVKEHGIKKVFEIGTFNGRTTLNIAANLPAGGKVYTLDLPKTKKVIPKYAVNIKDDAGWSDLTYLSKRNTGQLFKNAKEKNKITQLLDDSAVFDFSPYLGKMDMVFVDGAHSHEYVSNDTYAALALVRKGGYIVWHDYGVWRDVTYTLNQLHKSQKKLSSARHISGTSLVVLKI